MVNFRKVIFASAVFLEAVFCLRTDSAGQEIDINLGDKVVIDLSRFTEAESIKAEFDVDTASIPGSVITIFTDCSSQYEIDITPTTREEYHKLNEVLMDKCQWEVEKDGIKFLLRKDKDVTDTYQKEKVTCHIEHLLPTRISSINGFKLHCIF